MRRAFIAEKFPYSEIKDNTIGSKLVPIDMLRLKLSFFGAANLIQDRINGCVFACFKAHLYLLN